MSALPGNISSMIRRLPELDGKPYLGSDPLAGGTEFP